MKQIYFQHQAKSQTQQGISDANVQTCQAILSLKSQTTVDPIIPSSLVVRQVLERQRADLNIFLIQNKGKGPPGRRRSPGLIESFAWANQPAAFKELHPELAEGNTTLIKNELQKHIKTNFLTQLNFTIMKKQIFILILALFAVTTAFGQTPAPRPLDATCAPANSALTPYVGTQYTYTVDVPTTPVAWTNVTYHWFVTQQTTFITGSTLTSDRVASGTISSTAVYDNSANTANSIPITWTSSAASSANPYYLVVYVEGDANTCTNLNNIKVYEIKPVKSFLIDVANMSAPGTANILSTWDATTGAAPDFNPCMSKVESAVYNTSTKKMEYDYGTNYLYIAVTAANFGTNWNATFHLDGMVTGQIIGVEWTRNADFTGLASVTTTTAIGVGTQGVYTLNVPAVNTTTTAAGETIYIRVTVDNATQEGLADIPFTFAVDGLDESGNGDLHYKTCATDGFTNDVVHQTLKPRPTVDNSTTGVTDPGFLQP